MSLHELQASKRYASLDGIRVIAVLLVMTWHVRDGALSSLHGNNGVTLFFLLSGFLITSLALKEERGPDRFHYVAFLVRRAFRILPLFWLGIAAYAVMIFVLHLDDRSAAYARAIPWDLAYMPELPVFQAGPPTDHGLGAVPFSGVWSLGIEEKFYLVWPFVAFALLAKRPGRATLALVMTIALWSLWFWAPEQTTRFLINYAPILLGCALALGVNTRRGIQLARPVTHPIFAATVFVAATVLLLTDQSPSQAIAMQCMFGLLLITPVIRPGSIGARFLGSSTATRLGALTYATYLFHSLGLKVVDMVLPAGDSVLLSLVSLTSGIAVTLVAAVVLHATVELPFQQLGRRLSTSIKNRSTPLIDVSDPSVVRLAPSIHTANSDGAPVN